MRALSLRHQVGALSLVWCIIVFVLLSSVAMTALYSIRYERDPIVQIHQYLNRISDTEKLSRPRSSMKHEPAAIRKCIVNGRTVYSNMECGTKTNSSIVDIQDTQGIESPKAPQQRMAEYEDLPHGGVRMRKQALPGE